MVKLSASKIETYNKCTMLYYLSYVLKIKNPANDGSRRGQCLHLVLEQLLIDRRREYVKVILKQRTIEAVPSVLRYVRKQMRKQGLTEFDNKGENNFALINQMIVLGLSLDFHCEHSGGKLLDPETHFDYTSELGYNINGFIDKLVAIGDKIQILDYKSSSKVYAGEEGTTQAMVYSLWAYRVKRAMSAVRFIFLRFENNPYVDKQFSSEELEGYEQYLIKLTKYLDNFTWRKALAGLAADKGYPKDGTFSGIICCNPYAKYPGQLKKNGELMWACWAKWKFNYFAVYDKDGKYLYGSLEQPVLNDGEFVLEQEWHGCPKFNSENYKNC